MGVIVLSIRSLSGVTVLDPALSAGKPCSSWRVDRAKAWHTEFWPTASSMPGSHGVGAQLHIIGEFVQIGILDSVHPANINRWHGPRHVEQYNLSWYWLLVTVQGGGNDI